MPSATSVVSVQPITINEDDGQSIPRKCRRAISMPETLLHSNSIMKFRTVDESLHSIYGSESDSPKDRSLKFDKILIREYARTLGDNPSCSSGPPVR